MKDLWPITDRAEAGIMTGARGVLLKALGLCLAMAWPMRAAPDPDAGIELFVGMPETEVLQRLGPPEGSLSRADRKTLLYPEFSVELVDGRLVELRHHTPPVRSSGGDPDAAPAAGEPPDVRLLMNRIRTTRGVERAYAVRDCNGPWAAPAVPLLVNLLADRTPFKAVSGVPGGQPVVHLGMIAAESLAAIGPASWPDGLRVLATGSPVAQANVARALHLIALRSGDAVDRAAFHRQLLEAFDRVVNGSADDARYARALMVRILARIEGAAVLARLHRALDHTDPAFVATVIELLGSRRDPASIPLLTAIFLEPVGSDRRDKAAAALLEYRHPAAAAAAREGVPHPDARIRGQVAAILGESGTAHDVVFLARLLDDPESTVRGAAVRALRFIGEPAVKRPLVRRLLIETDPDVAREAGETLADIISKPETPAVVDALLPGLRHADSEQRARFAELVGRSGAPNAFGALVESARSDPDETVRARAVGFLDHFDTPERQDVILIALRTDPAARVRRAALQRVRYGSLRDRHRDILLEIVRTAPLERAQEAVFALADADQLQRDPRALAILVRSLTDRDPAIRERAEAVLFNEAGIPRYGQRGRLIGDNPAVWKAWWAEQGIVF